MIKRFGDLKIGDKFVYGDADKNIQILMVKCDPTSLSERRNLSLYNAKTVGDGWMSLFNDNDLVFVHDDSEKEKET